MRKRATQRVAVWIAAWALPGCLLLPSSASAAALLPGLPPEQAAHALQEAIRHHHPVRYDAELQVEALAENPKGEQIVRSTDVPLVYDPDPTVANDDEYFRLVGYNLAKVRVLAIPSRNVVGVKRKRLVPGHPGVVAVSHEGIVSTHNVGHVPAVVVRLGNGQRWDMPVGLDTVNEP